MAIVIHKRLPPFGAFPAHRLGGDYKQQLCLALSMGDGGGSVIKESSGKNDGTFHGTNLNRTSSPVGTALVLDGSTNWVEVPADTSFTGDQVNSPGPVFSIAVWVKWHSSSETYGVIYGEEDAGTFNMALFLKSDGSQAIYFTTGNADPISGAPTLVQDRWTLLVLTNGIDGGTNYYVDGRLVNRFNNWTGAQIANGNFRARIGGGSIFGSGRYINGAVGPVLKWYRQLAPAEVTRMWEQPTSIWDAYGRLYVAAPSGAQTITGAAGIPTAEAFGCLGGTVNVGNNQSIYAFCSSQGIASAEVFGVNGALAVAPNLTGDAGIPSAEVVSDGGSVAPNPGINGTYGIPSAEAFGQGALIQRLGLAVFINNVDYTDLIEVDTVHVTQRLSQAATAEFQFRDKGGTIHLAVGNEVLIYTSSPLVKLPSNSGGFPFTRIFGGTIDDLTESTEMALPTIKADVKCSDFSQILDRRTVGKYYDDAFGSLGIIVLDIVNTYLALDGIQYNQVDGDPGINFGAQLFQWETARQAFNRLSNLTGWDYQVDYYKSLRFFPKSTGSGSSPFNLVDNDKNPVAESVTARSYRGKYRNKQGVRSSAQTSALWGDIFSVAQPGPYPSNHQPPDGVRFDFITLFKINSAPIIKVNGNQVDPSRIIMLSQVASANPSSWDWYWIPGGEGVFQNLNNPRLTSADTLEVDYQTALSPIIWVFCQSEIDARAAIEGNSGIYEDVQDVPNITDPAALKQYATAMLNRYGCLNSIPRQIKYRTYRDGLFVGQLQNINLSKPLVSAANFLITQVDIHDVQKQFLEYSLQLDSGEYLGDWAQFFAAIVQRGQQAQPGAFVTYEWSLVPTIPGVVNPGMTSTGIFPLIRTCGHQVEIAQYFSVIANSLPNPNPASFQVLVNGNGIGAPLTPTQAGIEYRQYFQGGVGQTQFFAGDVFQILAQGGASGSIRDVTVKLVTAISVA